MENSSIVLIPQKQRTLSRLDWSNQSLRKCLHALGFSDEEIKYKPGSISVLKSWEGEEKVLLELVKKRWKSEVVKCHEASDTSDPVKWKALNTIYSVILKKITPSIRINPGKPIARFIEFECMVCKGTFKKKIVSWVQYKSSLCNSPECQKEYNRRRTRKQRERYRINKEIFCEHPECGKRVIITNWQGRRRYCSNDCRVSHWHLKNKTKVEEQRKIRQEKRPRWKEWWDTRTPEQQKEYRINHLKLRQNRIENETPEKRRERLDRTNQKRKEYLNRRIAMGNPVKYVYVKREVWLAKKKEQLKDKPWIYETILQKYLKPDGTISHAALKT